MTPAVSRDRELRHAISFEVGRFSKIRIIGLFGQADFDKFEGADEGDFLGIFWNVSKVRLDFIQHSGSPESRLIYRCSFASHTPMLLTSPTSYK